VLRSADARLPGVRFCPGADHDDEARPMVFGGAKSKVRLHRIIVACATIFGCPFRLIDRTIGAIGTPIRWPPL
jgi:hypothetical protein